MGALVGIGGGVEEGVGAEVVGVEDGVVGVGMALDAFHGEALPDVVGGGDAVHDGGYAEFFVVGAAFAIVCGEAVKAGGDEVVEVAFGKKVASELFESEFVVGEVVLEGVDDPVAEGVDFAALVLAEAFGVGVASEVEPDGGPAFAIVGRGEEAVDGVFEGLGRGVGFECVEFAWGGKQAGEVEGDTAKPFGAGSGRGGGEVVFGEGIANVLVDGMVVGLDGGEGPVAGPIGAFGDPLFKEGDFGLGERGAVGGFGHAFVVVGGELDATDEFGFRGAAGFDGGVSGVTDGEGFFAIDEVDAAGVFDTAVAGRAVLDEDGVYFVSEIHLPEN